MGGVPNRTSYELHLPVEPNAWLWTGWAEPNSDGEWTVSSRPADALRKIGATEHADDDLVRYR